MKTAHRQAAKGKPRYADDFPDAEPAPEPDDDWWRDFQPWPMPASDESLAAKEQQA